MKQERSGHKRKTGEMKEPITTNQSNRPPKLETPSALYTFENAEKTNDITLMNEYDPVTKKLRKEMDTRRLHSEPKTLEKDEHKGILILPNIGRPTGGDDEGDTKK